MANPLLLGQVEEIDLVLPQVRKMMEADGFYIGGDSDRPGFEVPLVVIAGRIFCFVIDKELDPERFLPSLCVSGPFRGPNLPSTDPADAAGAER